MKAILKAGHHHGSTYYEHLELQKAITENLRAQVSLDDGLKAVNRSGCRIVNH